MKFIKAVVILGPPPRCSGGFAGLPPAGLALGHHAPAGPKKELPESPHERRPAAHALQHVNVDDARRDSLHTIFRVFECPAYGGYNSARPRLFIRQGLRIPYMCTGTTLSFAQALLPLLPLLNRQEKVGQLMCPVRGRQVQ